MRKLTLGAAACVAIAAAGLLQSAGSGFAEPSSAAPATAAPAAIPNPDYAVVTGKLDAGGSFYLYADVENLLGGIIDKLEPLFAQNKDMAQFPGIARNLIATSGLNQLSDVGVSVVKLEGGMSRMKSFLRVKEMSGLLRLAGSGGEAIEGAKFLPADAGYAAVARFDLGPLLEIAAELLADLPGGQGRATVDQAVAFVRERAGVDLPTLIASLGHEWGASLVLDDERQVAVPVGSGEELKVPHPALLLYVEVKDRTLYDLMAAKLKEGKADPQSAEIAGADAALTVTVPKNPFSFEPTLAQSGNWLFLASSPELVAAALSGKPDFRSAPEFAKLSAGLPLDKASGVTYVTPRLLKQINRTVKDLEEVVRRASGSGGDTTWFGFLAGAVAANENPIGHVVVGVADELGFWRIAQGDAAAANSMQSMAAAPIVPILAAIAVPNFLEAQVRAKVSRTRNDMRSMATGIETYFVDNNRYPPSTTDPGRQTGKAPKALDNDRILSSFEGNSLTTPISYMTHYMADPFAKDEATFGYYAPENGWIVFSPGPDEKYDLDWTLYDPKAADPNRALLPFAFDPTNGTVSPGDIYRIKQ